MSFIAPVATDTNGDPKVTGAAQSLGKDDFLNLLVTKLQHQDPMNPMDDEDFIAQLAQFSSLEQMASIADGIESSNQWDYLQMQSLNNMMAAGLIGKEVVADFSGVYLDSTNEPSISYTLDKVATEIKFEIRDESGKLIETIVVDNPEMGEGSVKWDGKDSRGNRAPQGFYTVEAIASLGDGGTFTPNLQIVGIATTITYRDGASFVTVNGTEVTLGDIKSLSESQED